MVAAGNVCSLPREGSRLVGFGGRRTANVPHLEFETMGNYAKAKIKETILAVTGG